MTSVAAISISGLRHTVSIEACPLIFCVVGQMARQVATYLNKHGLPELLIPKLLQGDPSAVKPKFASAPVVK